MGRSIKQEVVANVRTQYGFCESITATATSPWCIRPLTSVGLKCGGGIDTASFCGRVKPPSGWDIRVTVDLTHEAACKLCVREIRKREAEEAAEERVMEANQQCCCGHAHGKHALYIRGGVNAKGSRYACTVDGCRLWAYCDLEMPETTVAAEAAGRE